MSIITRGGTNRVIELVKSKLIEKEPRYTSLLKEVEASSLTELFAHYLKIIGLDYVEAREKFRRVCEEC